MLQIGMELLVREQKIEQVGTKSPIFICQKQRTQTHRDKLSTTVVIGLYLQLNRLKSMLQVGFKRYRVTCQKGTKPTISLSVSCSAICPALSTEQCAPNCWTDSNVSICFFPHFLFVCCLYFCLFRCLSLCCCPFIMMKIGF